MPAHPLRTTVLPRDHTAGLPSWRPTIMYTVGLPRSNCHPHCAVDWRAAGNDAFCTGTATTAPRALRWRQPSNRQRLCCCYAPLPPTAQHWCAAVPGPAERTMQTVFIVRVVILLNLPALLMKTDIRHSSFTVAFGHLFKDHWRWERCFFYFVLLHAMAHYLPCFMAVGSCLFGFHLPPSRTSIPLLLAHAHTLRAPRVS